VLRPLADWKRRGVDVTYVPVDADGYWQVADVHNAIRPDTRLVAVVHASNVTGAVQPIEPLGDALVQQSPLLLIDAAQSVGHLPLSVRDLRADLLAAPAHKGLLAPQGMGILYVNPDIVEQVHSLRQGGTGTVSDEEMQPECMPSKFEAGTHNMIGLAGLLAACEYLLQDNRLKQIRANEAALTRRLLQGLAACDGIAVHGPTAGQPRVGVVSITVAGYDCQDVSSMLDTVAGVQTRAGLHCAPKMHKSLGTFSSGGTVRLSVGHANTDQDVDDALNALQQIAAATVKGEGLQ